MLPRVASVLAGLFLATPSVAAPVDIDGDGVSEMLVDAAGATMRSRAWNDLFADLDRDGQLEQFRIFENRVQVSAGGDQISLTFVAPVGNAWIRDADGDGLEELHIALVDGQAFAVPSLSLPTVGPGKLPRCASQHLPAACADPVAMWDSGTDLHNLWDSAAGGFDGDGRADLLGENWPTPTLRLYENDGNNRFALVFSTPLEDAPPGAYVAVCGGDSDRDGQGEIVGGETSTLNQVFLYESTADNTYVKRAINIREPDPSGNLSMGSVRIADADRDGRWEIIFDTSDVSGSKLFIYEHSGQPGENVYTKVYTYSTVSYLFHWTIGDSDNDGAEEIVLGFGGGGCLA